MLTCPIFESLQHIETAPKEILGDFPRLNRTGALNLINKMEAKLKGLPYVEDENNENGMFLSIDIKL